MTNQRIRKRRKDKAQKIGGEEEQHKSKTELERRRKRKKNMKARDV